MKASTKIAIAVKLARAAYCDYSRIVLGQDVRYRSPVVRWDRRYGWIIDQRRYPNQTAVQIIDYFDGLQRDYHQSIIDHFQKPKPTLDDDLTAASDKDVANSAT